MSVADASPPAGSISETLRRLVGGFLLAFLPLTPLYAYDLAWYAYSADEAAVTSGSPTPFSPVAALLMSALIFVSPFAAGLWHRGLGVVGGVTGMAAAASVAMLAYTWFLWVVYPPGTAPGSADAPVWVGSSLLLIALLVGIPCGAAGWGVAALASRIRRMHARSAPSAG